MNAVVIVAGGKGLRMGGDIPKQFLPIGGRPVLMRTIERFRQADPQMQVVLVLPESQQDHWRALCADHAFCHPVVVANGGATRFHSVRNGLAAVPPDCRYIGVHDGVRPFVSPEVIRRCYAEAMESGAAVPVVDVVETLRHITREGSATVPRGDYKLVQTPQVFEASLLREAYEQPYTELFTDDASVVEALGRRIALVPGNRENIKITTPYDLRVCPCLLDG